MKINEFENDTSTYNYYKLLLSNKETLSSDTTVQLQSFGDLIRYFLKSTLRDQIWNPGFEFLKVY